MQALVFDGPAADTSTTRLAEMPIPLPGPGEVSIDVKYAGVNFKDVMARRGDPGYVPQWPFVPGLEVAGTIRQLGSGVKDLVPGGPVAALTNAGGLAQVALADATLTVAVPTGVVLQQAAAAPGVLTTAVLLLGRFGRLTRGETLLVHSAAGGVGHAVAQLALISNVGKLLGTVGSLARQASAQAAGYHMVFLRGPELASEIRAHTEGRGIDLILDPQGTNLLETDLEVAAPGGRIVLFGNAGGRTLFALPPTGRLFATNTSSAASASPPCRPPRRLWSGTPSPPP